MRPEEAAWIGQAVRRIPELRTVLNIGSSTGHFRTSTQPHIDREIFAPLAHRGVRVIHCDMKQAEGVDLVGDLLDPAFRLEVESLEADVVLANNLFEHVRDRERLAVVLSGLPREGGRLIVSVPYRYPYHADPIDTLFRPTPQQIAALFPDFAVEEGTVIESTSLWRDLKTKLGLAGAAKDVAHRVGRLMFPFIRPRAWRATLANLVWLRATRSVSVVTLVKPAAGTAE